MSIKLTPIALFLINTSFDLGSEKSILFFWRTLISPGFSATIEYIERTYHQKKWINSLFKYLEILIWKNPKKDVKIGIHIFQELLMIFISGMKYLYPDNNNNNNNNNFNI